MGIWTPGPGPTAGDDVFVGDAASDIASGADGDDTLNGGDGNDRLFGGAGKDLLSGSGGMDLLDGGPDGFDTLSGGAGDDILRVTGSGNHISGGPGLDRFVFIGAQGSTDNRIADLAPGDTLQWVDLSTVSSITEGTGAALGRGALTYSVSGNITTLSIGLDTVPGADATLVLENFSTPTQLQIVDGLLAVVDATVTVGAALSGTLSGLSQDNIYLGVGYDSAIKELTVIDTLGDATVSAQNLVGFSSGPVTYWSSGVSNSRFTFGDGDIDFNASVDQGYYASGISGGSLTTGAGRTTIGVVVVEASSGGSFVYGASGITSWQLAAGAGADILEVTVVSNKPETLSTSGIGGSVLDLGDGDDTVFVDVSNESGNPEPLAVVGTVLDLGSGNDSLKVYSSGTGFESSTVLGASGDDAIIVNSVRDTLRATRLLTGDGNDTVALSTSGLNNAELFASSVELGEGDDTLELRFAVDSVVDGGSGNDTVRLRDADFVYRMATQADGAVLVTRPDNALFSLTLRNVEALQFGSGASTSSYAGSPLTGYLTGTAEGDDVYQGSGLSSAIDSLVVKDLVGNDRVVARNVTESGSIASYVSSAIVNSSFTFGDGNIQYDAKINQGYYATAITGGSLTMGSGPSYINVQAVEDFPSDRTAFYYGVTGAQNWTLSAGGGRDVLNVVVMGSKKDTFNSTGIGGGAYDLGEGNDVVNVSVVNRAGTGESVGLNGVSVFDLGSGDDLVRMVSTGYGVRSTTLVGGSGSDTLDVSAVRNAIADTSIDMGDGSDAVFAKSSAGNSADLLNSVINLGAGDDYLEIRTAIGSTVDGGPGYDILMLRDLQSSYALTKHADGSISITRPGDQFFSLTVNNIEAVVYGNLPVRSAYSGSPLTGFLSGSPALNDTYRGWGLSAAIENLSVNDSEGNDWIVAENLSTSGQTEAYVASAIVTSNFLMGAGTITLNAHINQGYYATAIAGGSLTMGGGESYLDVRAVEDFPGARRAFIYAVTGVENWSLSAGAGRDVLNVAVESNQDWQGFRCIGVNAGTLDLGDGDDVVNVASMNASGTREAFGINAATLNLGADNDVLTVLSSGVGIGGTTLQAGSGQDFIAVRSAAEAVKDSSLMLGPDTDHVFLASTGGGADLDASTVDLGEGDDYIELGSARHSTIIGGEGQDILRLTGAPADYAFTAQSDGSILVTSDTGRIDRLIVTGIEQIVYGASENAGVAVYAVTGAVTVYETLSAQLVSGDPDRAASSELRYQWQISSDGVSWSDVGHNQTYMIRPEDQGKVIRLTVGYFDLGGHYEVTSSEVTGAVLAPSQVPTTSAAAANAGEVLSSSYSVPDGVAVASLQATDYTGAFGNVSDNQIIGNQLGNFIDGGKGNDSLIGGSGGDVLIGGDGDDTLDGQAGNDTLNGGGGDIDTARFWDVRANYTITENSDGSWQVAHTGFNPANVPVGQALISDGIDTLFNIEQAQFADQIFSFIPVAATGAPVISDTTPTEGQTLVLDTASIADGNGLGTFALQWQASSDGQTWQNIAGAATTAYSPQDALFASFARGAAVQLRAVASFTDGAGNAESVASAATAAVLAVNDGTAAVTIAGTATVGQTLSASLTADPDGDGTTPQYQWLRNGLAIDGATAATYVLAAADGNQQISVRASYTDHQGFDEAPVSAATARIQAPATGAPVILDTTPTEGSVLNINNASIADGNGLGAFAYQWQASANGTTWINIAGATAATFTPQDLAGITAGAQAGQFLRIAVSFTDGTGVRETVVSSATSVTGRNWEAANSNAAAFSGTAGDDIARGRAGTDTLTGNAGDDALFGAGGNDVLNGGFGNDVLDGGADADALDGGDGNDSLFGAGGNDTLTGGAGNDAINGGGGTDIAGYATVLTAVSFSNTGTNIVVDAGAEGVDTLSLVETLRFKNVVYTVEPGTAASNTLTGGAGSQILFGFGGADTINGGAGNDVIVAGDGNDFINQAAATGNRDIIDGGAGADTFTLTGNGTAETFRIYTRIEALAAGMTDLHDNTEIVVTRNGSTNTSIIAELDNIEEIVVSSLRVTSPAGANGGTVSGDTIQVVGDFNQTSLNFNTITINGTQANDVVDISALESAHRIVFTSNGGQDTVIGALRPQDIVNMGPAASSSAARDGSGPLNRVAPAGDAIAVSGDFRAFGASDGIEAMTGVRTDLRELAMAGPRNEVAGRTMIDMDDLLLDLVDSGPVASADIAMPIVIDTDSFFDHRSVLTDYAIS